MSREAPERPQTAGFRTLADVADWIVATCLAFGAPLHVALHVAALFVEDAKVRARFG